MIIFIWGLPGAGKSTIGKTVSKRLNMPFYEMDDYLPKLFKEKMEKGELITDEDRNSFFANFTNILKEKDGDIVVSGYVAKKKHRDLLSELGDLTFFELDVPENVLRERLKARKEHFFKEETLKKVLLNYEQLTDSIKIDASKDIENVVKQIVNSIKGDSHL